jgi:DNA-directed RNA polymerase subunit L
MFSDYQKDKFGRVTFAIKDVDLSIVNALRRLILTDIPVVGFLGEGETSLQAVQNNGPLHNEIMLHRLGLVPIHFSDDETEAFDSEDYSFELNKSNETATMVNVTSHDFKVSKADKELPVKEVNRLFPPNPVTGDHVLITRLRQNEALHLKGTALKSTARKHSGFSPVSLCNFKYIEDPVQSTKVEGVLNKERAFLKNEYGDPTSFLFEIEVENGLTVKYLVSKALDILTDKLRNITTELYNPESEYVSIAKAENGVGFEFAFRNEDDTLGNYLQSTMHNHFIRNESNLNRQNKKVTYVGYYCPHPLDNVMKLKICIDDENDAQIEFIEVLNEHCRRCLMELQTIKTEWGRV